MVAHRRTTGATHLTSLSLFPRLTPSPPEPRHPHRWGVGRIHRIDWGLSCSGETPHPPPAPPSGGETVERRQPDNWRTRRSVGNGGPTTDCIPPTAPPNSVGGGEFWERPGIGSGVDTHSGGVLNTSPFPSEVVGLSRRYDSLPRIYCK